MKYSKEDLDKIRTQIDMVAWLENRGVTFRDAGTSQLALCPVHSERTPSFHVKPGYQTFKCYGCGIGGDIFSLAMEVEQLSFPGAIQMLAEELGIKLEVSNDPEYEYRSRLLLITRLTHEWFRHSYLNLDEDHPARINLKERNLLEFSYTDDSVGFAPNRGLVDILRKKGFTDNEMIDAGIVYPPKDDQPIRERFRNRLTWTIYNVQGKPIGFSARKLFDNDNGPKYLNSPQTKLYNKSKALLGLSAAKRSITSKQQVYVVEGQTDVMALKAAGFENTVASCGTAFGQEHANMLLQLSKLGKETNKFEIIFCFDGDEAGINASRKVFYSIPNIHLNAKAIKFTNPAGEPTDPCDFRIFFGNNQLVNLIETKQAPLVEFILSEEITNWDIKTSEGKTGYINSATKILETVQDPIQRVDYFKKISTWTGVAYNDLSGRVGRYSVSGGNSNQAEAIVQNAYQAQIDNTDKQEITVLAAITQYPVESQKILSEQTFITKDFFPTLPDLANYIIENIRYGYPLDYTHQQVVDLSHHSLIISDDNIEAAIALILKTYLKYAQDKELKQVEEELFSTVDYNPIVLFEQMDIAKKTILEKYKLN